MGNERKHSKDMRTLPVQLCAVSALFAAIAWGQENSDGEAGFPSDATLTAKLEEVSAAEAAKPAPAAVIPTQTPAEGAPTRPVVTMTDEPAIESAPELHIGTGSVAWNTQLKESEAQRALQEARARRNLYRDIALASSPLPVTRTAQEFLAANPPVIQPVEEIGGENQGPRPIMEVRSSNVPEFNTTRTAPRPVQSQEMPKKNGNLFSFLKPKEKVEATPADFQNPYTRAAEPGSETPEFETGGSDGGTGSMDPETLDAMIAEATVGGPPAGGSSDDGGNVLKKLFGKKSAPTPAPSSPRAPAASTFAAGPSTPPPSAPPIPVAADRPSGDLDLSIPSPPNVNAPEPEMPAPVASTPPPAPAEDSGASIFRKEEPKPAIFRSE